VCVCVCVWIGVSGKDVLGTRVLHSSWSAKQAGVRAFG
jgi:hypothetical protein